MASLLARPWDLHQDAAIPSRVIPPRAMRSHGLACGSPWDDPEVRAPLIPFQMPISEIQKPHPIVFLNRVPSILQMIADLGI